MVFKDGKQFDSCQCSIMVQACAWDVAEILDPAYTPSTQDKKDLFLEDRNTCFCCFWLDSADRHWQDPSKNMKRITIPGRSVKQWWKYYLKSTKPCWTPQRSCPTSHLPIMLLVCGKNLHTASSFTGKTSSDSHKCVMLMHAVMELQSVRNQADQHRDWEGAHLWVIL